MMTAQIPTFDETTSSFRRRLRSLLGGRKGVSAAQDAHRQHEEVSDRDHGDVGREMTPSGFRLTGQSCHSSCSHPSVLIAP
jgi:hypothetical protein